MNEIENKVLDYLKTQQIEYEKIDIDPNFSDTQNFCKKYNFSLDQSANTIILESKRPKGLYAIAVVRASKKLDVNTKLKNIMGVKKLSFANAVKSEEITGMKVGGITPFGLSQKFQIYFDEGLKLSKKIVFGGGSRNFKILIEPIYLPNIPNAQFLDITEN